MNASLKTTQYHQRIDHSLNIDLIGFVAQNDEDSFMIKNLCQASGLSLSTVHRALKKLIAQGLVRRVTGGKAMVFTAARTQTHRSDLYGPCVSGTDIPADPISLFIVAPDPQRILTIRRNSSRQYFMGIRKRIDMGRVGIIIVPEERGQTPRWRPISFLSGHSS
jgi:DNA-binding transcriptional MocR family regulator